MVQALAQALAGAGLQTLGAPPALAALAALAASQAGAAAAPTGGHGGVLVGNITGLYGVLAARSEAPTSTAAVADALRRWPGQVAVGGGRYSMGGQVAITGGLHLDLRGLNQLVWLRAADKQVRVQAGMRWRDLQDLLDGHNLAVKTMQSYANFSIGGAVSVNAHGRYVGHGPVGHTVRALQLVLADGRVVEASRSAEPALFAAAIGGYGAVGVITEVELDLADNQRIERVIQPVALADYPAWFAQQVLADPACVMHNADLAPPNFDAPVAVTWRRSDKPLTQPARLVPRHGRYPLEHGALWALTELPGAATLRKKVVEPLLVNKPEVAWLNHEASLDVAKLEPRSRRTTTWVLQEYFVPQRHFLPFAQGLAATLRRHRVEALNVSIRHSPADTVSLLPWAKEPVFSFVLYHRQRTDARARAAVGEWTRELVDLTLAHDGRYYLPYQLHASRAQFERAYPEVAALRRLKASVDPRGRFSNELWAKYL
jgi:FAD/FMN-containing dehydrogenase